MTQDLKLVGPFQPDKTDSNVSWTKSNSTYTLPTYTSYTSNSDTDAVINSSSGAVHYSWYSAAAGTGLKAFSVQGDNISDSICPKGWRLPTGGPSGEYVALTTYYNTVALLEGLYGPSFVRSGYNTSGNVNMAYYTSSTTYSDRYIYYFRFSETEIFPQNYTFKVYGMSIRCIDKRD